MSGTTAQTRPLGIGALGTGAIAPPYFIVLQAWPQLQLISCTSRGMARARAAAERYGIAAVEFAAMLADPAIDAVVNLTPIAATAAQGRCRTPIPTGLPVGSACCQGTVMLSRITRTE